MDGNFLVLPYTRSLDVGVNEIIQRYSFNRNSVRLLSNDLALESLYEQYLLSMNVFEYTKGHQYRQNDLLWVKRSFGDFKLFLVRCIIDVNTSNLQYIVDSAYVEGADKQPTPEFDKYGWKDENSYIDIEDYGIRAKLRRYFTQRFDSHENTDLYHRFGVLRNNEIEINKKILLSDLTNADKDRELVFYPYYTCAIQPDNAVLQGFYKVWDSGIIELDIVYRMGYRGQVQLDGYSGDMLECNTYSLRGIQYSNSETSKYFSTTKDRDIFAPLSCGQSVVDDIVQANRNGIANTYTAEINFPRFRFNGKTILFTDNRYMIFGSDVMSQDADMLSAQIEPGANCVTYCNKTKNGFTAIYVTYPDNNQFHSVEYNATNGGLVSNSFHCHVIGRWVEEPIQI